MDKIKLHFIYQFGKCKNELKQSDELLQSSYCQWNQHHFYANVYPTSKYHQVINKNEIALFYIEKNTVNIEAILSNCFVAPNMVGFIVPHEKDDNYRFAIRSKCAIGNTANDEISLMTFRSNDTHQVLCAQNQLFGNLLACDRDLSKSAQLASDTTAHTTTTTTTMAAPTPTTNNSNSRFSMIKQDLVRKKSKSTFKLFTALASPANKPSNKEKLGHARSASSSGSGTTTASSTNTTMPSSPSPSSTPTRPRTTSTYSEYILGLETSSSSIYHSSSSASSTHSNNSIKSQHSHESRLTLQSLASKELLPQQSSLHRLASESSASINQQRYFSPSFHPSRTASYEIQSAATKRVSEELYPIFTNNNNSNPGTSTSKIDYLLSSRSRSPLSIREPTPTMIEPGSGFSTLQSQASSTISTFNSPLPHYQLQDHTPPHHQRLMDNATPSSRPLSDLIIPIATPNSKEFSVYSTSADAAYKRSSLGSDIHLELEERNKTILMLTSLLQKKEEEIDMLKADLDDSVSELGTVCDKFNSELDHLATMYSQEQLERPAHPSPDTQIRKKLETTLRERNQWQLRATELEHQLRSLLLNQQQQQQQGNKYSHTRQPYQPQHHKRSLSHGGGPASSILPRVNNNM
ncbi:hypothetical protein MBANPS3_000717 [Mucor bainieri]